MGRLSFDFEAIRTAPGPSSSPHESLRAAQVIGKIAQLALSTEAEQTPINKEIHHFIQIISAIAFALGISFFAAALGMGQDAVTSLVFMIGIIVANVRLAASS